MEELMRSSLPTLLKFLIIKVILLGAYPFLASKTLSIMDRENIPEIIKEYKEDFFGIYDPIIHQQDFE